MMLVVKLDFGLVSKTEEMTVEELRETPFFQGVGQEDFDEIIKYVERGETVRYADYLIKKKVD